MDKKKFALILVGSILAAFLGAFVAIYSVFGNLFNVHEAVLANNDIKVDVDDSFSQVNKMFEEHRKMINDFNHNFDNMPLGFTSIENKGLVNQASIQTENLKDSYKIKIDLRPFNNDKNNIDVKIKDNTLNIFAKYESRDKKEFNSSQFCQSLRLSKEFDLKGIQQQTKGNELVIIIPKIKQAKN